MNQDQNFLTFQVLTNQILRWFTAERNQHDVARFMAGVVLFGPRFEYGRCRTFPATFTEFLACLRLVESCSYFDERDFNRLRLVSSEWNAFVGAWDELKAIAYANKGRQPGQVLVSFFEKEKRYAYRIARLYQEREPSWLVPIETRDYAAMVGQISKEPMEFCGQTVWVDKVPAALLPPGCHGVLSAADNRRCYLMMTTDPELLAKA